MKIYDAEMQYLNVAYAKGVGLDRNNCVVAFNNDLISREDAGLSLLLVYSVVAPSYGYPVRKLVDARSPIAISQFLAEAWSADRGLGMPLRLEVKPGILAAERGFVEWVRSLSIDCVPATSIQGINGYERSSQALQFAIEWDLPDRYSREHRNHIKLNLANEGVRSYDIFSSVMHGVRKSMEQLTFDAWNTRDRKFFSGNSILTDWDTSCLIDRKKPRPKEHLVARPEEDPPISVSGLKEVVAMWPGGRASFFNGLDITARDFDFWIAGKAHIPHDDFITVAAQANIGYEDRYGEWSLLGGGLLVANTRKNAITAFNVLSHGGDLQMACEVLGPCGLTLPFRVLIFQPWGGEMNMMLFQRDGGVETVLDDASLINLGKAVCVPQNVWETVAMIVDDREQFKTPARVAAGFASKHAAWLVKNSNWL